jgi:hypothetical protein
MPTVTCAIKVTWGQINIQRSYGFKRRKLISQDKNLGKNGRF